MNRSIIEGIHAATGGSIDPIMERFHRHSAEEEAAWKALEKLVEPLDYELTNKLFDCVTRYSAAAEADAFADGFRLATALIMETLGAGNADGREESA